MPCFGMPAELAHAEELDVEAEVLGGSLGYSFNCLVLVLVIRKGEGDGDREKYRCIYSVHNLLKERRLDRSRWEIRVRQVRCAQRPCRYLYCL
jgi:hypothetical protein